MRVWRRWLCAIWLLVPAAPALAQEAEEPAVKFQLFNLHHRTADALIPLVAPLIAPDGIVTGRDMQLVVSAPPSILNQLAPLIAELDRPELSLVISVRQRRTSIANDESDARRRISTTAPGDLRQAAMAATVAGQPVFIETELALPYAGVAVDTRTWGRRGAASIESQSLTSGFLARASVLDHTVTVSLQAELSRPEKTGGGATSSQRANLTASGPMGEWFTIAQTATGPDVTSGTEAEQRRLVTTTHPSNDHFLLEVRVDIPQL